MLDKLKSLFIEEDATSASTSQDKQTVPKPTKQQSQTPTKSSTETHKVSMDGPVDKTAKPNAKFVNILLTAIEENNLQGFDYLEYKKSLQSLSNMDMDEATKYKSAFAMAKTMGLDAKKLIDSAKHYTSILAKEKSKFGDTLAAQKQRQIVAREEGIKGREKEIVQLQQKIEAIKKQIDQRKAELEKEKGQIDVSMGKINQAKDGFLVAYAKVFDQINVDIKKMEQYLG